MSFIQPIQVEEEVETLDFRGIVRLFWRYRRTVILTCVVSLALSLVMALMTEPYYRATTVVTYVHAKGMGQGAGNFEQAIGGLASLAGMNLLGPGQEDSEALAVLDSNRLAAEFIQRNNLMPVLLRNAKKTPTMWRAVKQLKEGVLQVHKDPRKGVTTIVVVWRDAQEAARWANGIAALANEEIRKRTIDESTRNVTYLNEQVAKTSDVDLRRVLYDILESETKTLMLANARAEYAFQVVDPAVAPEIKAGPHRSLIVLGGLLLGLLLSGGYAIARDRYQHYRRAQGAHTQAQ